MVPVSVDGEQVRLAVVTCKPPGAGPFPTLIFHHGSTGGGTDPSLFARPFEPGPFIDWFTSRGWAVVVLPDRRGRGGSEGLYDEGFSDDRSQDYSCDAARLLWGAERTLREVVNQGLFRRNMALAPPSLWLYGTHDPFYSIAHSRANFAAFEAAGGRSTFHEFQPPPGRLHGRLIIYFPVLWGTTMEHYLAERGLPAQVP